MRLSLISRHIKKVLATTKQVDGYCKNHKGKKDNNSSAENSHPADNTFVIGAAFRTHLVHSCGTLLHQTEQNAPV